MKIHKKYEHHSKGTFYYGKREEIPLRINLSSFSSIKMTDPLHFHKKSTQFFLVVEGEITLEVNGKSVTLSKDNLLEIVPKEKYRVRRVKKGSKYVVIGTKNAEGDRVEVY